MVHEIFTQLDSFIAKTYEDLTKNIDCIKKTIREEDYSAGEYKENIHKLAKYKDILHHMQNAIEYNSEKQKHVKIINEIEKEINERNIGRGIYYMIDEINDALARSPPRYNLASSRITLIIHLLKISYNTIPIFTRTDIIKRLNLCIDYYNQKVPYKKYHGKIIQLQPYTNFLYDSILLITWECHSCKKTWDDSISISLDVFTPICKYCNNINVDMYNQEHRVQLKKQNKILSSFNFLKNIRHK